VSERLRRSIGLKRPVLAHVNIVCVLDREGGRWMTTGGDSVPLSGEERSGPEGGEVGGDPMDDEGPTSEECIPGDEPGAEDGLPGVGRGEAGVGLPYMAGCGCTCMTGGGTMVLAGACLEAARSIRKSKLEAVSGERSGKEANGKTNSSKVT
jgi:hypothetical protein